MLINIIMATKNRGGRFFHNSGTRIEQAPQPQSIPTATGMIRAPHRSRYAGVPATIRHNELGFSGMKYHNGDSMNLLSRNYLIGGKTYSNQIGGSNSY